MGDFGWLVDLFGESLMGALRRGPFMRRSVLTHFSESHNSLLEFEIGNGDPLKQCQMVPLCIAKHSSNSQGALKLR
jgi:hypothetical protein